MKLVVAPRKPFPSYKWRWATLTPTEGLNKPSVFLGVLRVYNRFQKHSPTSDQIRKALKQVQDETKSTVDLERTRERNLWRNSQQYWSSLGLIANSSGVIELSTFGKNLANGDITQTEFASTVIKSLELPNKRIERAEVISDWNNAGLKIKPFEVILGTIRLLKLRYGNDEAFVTPDDLIHIIIPAAGSKYELEVIADAIYQFRNEWIEVDTWPDCAPAANDRRMAKEFLMFLANYGFCRTIDTGGGPYSERYYLNNLDESEIDFIHNLGIASDKPTEILAELRLAKIPDNVDRRRVLRGILERPYQSIFRKNVLKAFNAKCVISGVDIDSVLEAAHIIPVSENGEDNIQNSLCLRSDIHQLFDCNHLKISPTGELHFTNTAAQLHNYGSLTKKIQIPSFVSLSNIEWRWNYS